MENDDYKVYVVERDGPLPRRLAGRFLRRNCVYEVRNCSDPNIIIERSHDPEELGRKTTVLLLKKHTNHLSTVNISSLPRGTFARYLRGHLSVYQNGSHVDVISEKEEDNR